MAKTREAPPLGWAWNPLSERQREMLGKVEFDWDRHAALKMVVAHDLLAITAVTPACHSIVALCTNGAGKVRDGHRTAYRCIETLAPLPSNAHRRTDTSVVGRHAEWALAWAAIGSEKAVPASMATWEPKMRPVLLAPTHSSWQSTPLTVWQISPLAPESMVPHLDVIERCRLADDPRMTAA